MPRADVSFDAALFASLAWSDLAAAALAARDFRRAASDLAQAQAWFDVAVALSAVRPLPPTFR